MLAENLRLRKTFHDTWQRRDLPGLVVLAAIVLWLRGFHPLVLLCQQQLTHSAPAGRHRHTLGPPAPAAAATLCRISSLDGRGLLLGAFHCTKGDHSGNLDGEQGLGGAIRNQTESTSFLLRVNTST